MLEEGYVNLESIEQEEANVYRDSVSVINVHKEVVTVFTFQCIAIE